MKRIKSFADRWPVIFLVIFFIIFSGVYIFYHNYVQPATEYQWDIMFLKLLITISSLWFVSALFGREFLNGFTWKRSLPQLKFIWPFLIFVLVNVASTSRVLFAGNKINAYSFIMYLLANLVTGLYEEVGVRVIVVGHLMKAFEGKKSRFFLSIFISSVIFGLVHINNIVRTGGEAIFQTVYALFIGILFSALYIRFKSIWVSVLVHGLFDFTQNLADIFSMPGERAPYILDSFPNEFFYTVNILWIPIVFIISIGSLILGIILVRKSKRDEITALWNETA